MKTLYPAIVILCPLCTTAAGQNTFRLNIGSKNVSFTDMVIAKNRDLIVNGNYEGGNAIFRISADGKIKWSKSFSKIPVAITATNDNGYIQCLLEKPFLFVMKCDSNGTVEWTKKITSIAYSFNVYDVIFQSETGNYYIGTGDHFNSVQILKLDANGNLVWNRSFTEKYLDYGLSPVFISELKDDQLLLSVSVTSCDYYCTVLDLVKFDTSGNFISASRFDAPYPYESPIPISITKTKALFNIFSSNKYYYAYTNFDFTNNTIKGVVFPFDAFSLQSFAKNNNTAELKNKSLHIGDSSVIIKNDWSIYNGYSTWKNYARINNYDSLGRICPNYTLPSAGAVTDSITYNLYPVKIVPLLNNILITDTIIKGKNISIDSLICTGTAPAFVKDILVSASIKTQKSSILFPNPATSFVTVNYTGKQDQTATIQFFNVAGNLVKTGKLNLSAGDNIKTINIVNLPAGNYFVKLVLADAQQNFSFVKQ